MHDEVKRLAEEKMNFYGTWLTNYRTAAEIAPFIQQAYEISKWAFEATCNAPTEVTREVSYHNLAPLYQRELEYVKDALTPINQYEPQLIVSTLAGTTASSIETYSFAKSFEKSDNPMVVSWSKQCTPHYERIQESAKRDEEVRDLLHNLNPERADEFDQAEKEYRLALGGSAPPEAAGSTMRNVLDHCKGDLLARATKRKLHKRHHWPTIADKLSKGPKDGLHYCNLLEQGKKWPDLYDRLSHVTKDFPSATDLKAIHTEFIDYLYVVLIAITTD